MSYIPHANNLTKNYLKKNPITNNTTDEISNQSEEKKGLFSKIPQETFETKPAKKLNPTTKLITEEYDAKEVLPRTIYNYDIGVEKFTKYLKTVTKPVFKVYDNYYYYQYVLSINKGKKSGFIEKTISQKWLDSENIHQKISQISNIDLLHNEINLMNRYDFHLIAKIIRYKINRYEILEIIIPEHKYKIDMNNFTRKLITHPEELGLPEKTTFIRKRVTDVKTKSISTKSESDSKKHIVSPQSKPYIPKSRRRRMYSNSKN